MNPWASPASSATAAGPRSRSARLASAQLAQDLLTGLAELVHPHGTVDSAGSIRHYVSALRVMDAALAEHGFTGGAADLRRSQVAEFWMGTTGAKEACTRRMLLGLAAAGGTLDARVRELAEGRAYNPQPFRRPLPPYPEAVWSRLTEACQSAVTDGIPGAPGRAGRGGPRPRSRRRRPQPGRPAVAAGPQGPHVDSRRRGARRDVR